MLPINRTVILRTAYQHLFSRRPILSIYSIKLLSTTSHGNNKRHRTSLSPSSHHPHPHSHSHFHRVNPNKTNSSENTLRRLFQPIDVKPMVHTDKVDPTSSTDTTTNVGQELTGGKTLDRSINQNKLYNVFKIEYMLCCFHRFTSSYRN